MSIRSIIANFIFALLLYFLNGILGRLKTASWIPFEYSSFEFYNNSNKNFSENFLQSIIHPTIFLAIISAILQENTLGYIVPDLWLIIPIYWLLRFLHALIWDFLSFINWKFEFISLAISLLIGEGALVLIILPLLNSNKTIFIDLEEFRDAFWFAVFTYIVVQLWTGFKAKSTGEAVYPSEIQANVIQRRYLKYKQKYGSYIESILSSECTFQIASHKEHFICLLYAIMIYEDHNRPFIIRYFEYLIKILFYDRKFTLGIMQVQTKRLISDKKSIELAIQRLNKSFSRSETHKKLYATISEYNPSDDYYREVISIYEEIKTSLALNELGTHRVVVRKRNMKPKQQS